ncbi:MAG: carboxypeptidase M32, partial [Coleofasciculaceae cyanobacterium SM2_3_26]|nr:carboxypeptidase M32 [Coleofasciculaceae cyanobacterium SM2_3_26]
MPPGGARTRAQQMATLRQIAHSKLVSPELGELLESLRSLEQDLPYDSNEASLIRVSRRQYQQAVQVPASFMATLSAHQAECYAAWAHAKAESALERKTFAIVRPYLEKTLALSQELANFFP